MTTVRYTPMLEQYREIKSKHTGEILFFRLGDFYEMFFEDAELAARELEITLTSRDGGQSTRIPMCGVPYHSAENYIARLISKGYKVAICEQVEDPKLVKGLVKREVVKIITPGTVISETFLPDTGNNYLAVIYEEEETLLLAAGDISTGECLWSSFNGPHRLLGLCDQLFRLAPAELLLGSVIDNSERLQSFLANRLPQCATSTLVIDDFQKIEELPAQHFALDDLPKQPKALTAIGMLLYYLHDTAKSNLAHINRLSYYDASEHLIIDAATLRNLEITRNLRDGGKKGTLLAVLDHTKTAMGGRLLKKWLEYPLLHTQAIVHRQNAIAACLEQRAAEQALQEQLSSVYDLERILTRIEVGTANARDLVALKSSLAVLPAVKDQLAVLKAPLLQQLYNEIQAHADIVNLIHTAIIDTPPFSVREGGLIKTGYDLELDELHEIARNSKQFIQNIELREKESTGIKSLKVGYNKVFGYYLEVTHTHSESVPAHYIRKQTLANAERYITPELKEFETKVLGAQEKIVTIEYHLFTKIRDYVKEQMHSIQKTARALAELDALLSLAEAAVRYNYVRPRLTDSREITIRDGRHPVVERLLVREMFVPNDTELNHQVNEIMLITGPNMAGKSTYMRQVALLVLMAQVGSYLPAREAVISPVDRIFTRVGASDDLSTGQSTFMVEMNEVSYILKHATKNSLIILDEIGRGTSTFDGMSIAKAVIEYIREKIRAKTLFATHYHELITLEEHSPVIKNYSVAVKEKGSDVVFLRRIIPGGADKSYGIHVAQLAGLPKKVIERAQHILHDLEATAPNAVTTAPAETKAVTETAASTVSGLQSLSLFGSSLSDELLQVDIMSTTPLEALNILHRLQQQAKQEAGKL